MPTPYTMKFIIMVWLAFLARHRPGLDDREARLHEHDEEAGDERPDEVDRDLVLADVVDDVAESSGPSSGRSTRDVCRGARHRAGGVALGPVLRVWARRPP